MKPYSSGECLLKLDLEANQMAFFLGSRIVIEQQKKSNEKRYKISRSGFLMLNIKKSGRLLEEFRQINLLLENFSLH